MKLEKREPRDYEEEDDEEEEDEEEEEVEMEGWRKREGREAKVVR